MRSAVVLAAFALLAVTAAAARGQDGKSFRCGASAGKVTSVEPAVKVAKVAISSNVLLSTCVGIGTSDGQLEFKLKLDGVDCRVKPGSIVKVEPSDGVLVHFKQGHSKCLTQDVGRRRFSAGQDLPLQGDPLFSVTVRGPRVAVHVARGFLQVGTNKVIVGPKQQAVGQNQSAEPPKSLPPADVASLLNSTVAAAVPKLQLSQPLPGNSQTLARILARDRLRVGIAGGSQTGAGVLRFVKSYFSFLSRKWQLRAPVFMTARGPDTPASLLAKKKIDVVVTFEPPTKSQSEVLFLDRAQRAWSIAIVPDPVFFDSLDRFTQSALDSGAYGKRYVNSFHTKQPAYGVLRPQLFPNVTCAPPPETDFTSPYNLVLKLHSDPAGPLAAGQSVKRTATATNKGPRSLPCVTVHFHLFVDSLQQTASADAKDGCRPDQTAEQRAAHELVLSCEIGPLAPGDSASATLTSTPKSANPNVSTETCASVDAQESGGQPESYIGDNGQCAQIVYRAKTLVVGAADDSLQAWQKDPTASRMPLVRKAGLGAVVITAHWAPGQTMPSADDLAYLKTTMAAAKGLQVFLAVVNGDLESPPHQVSPPLDAAARAEFAQYAVSIVETFPQIDDVIVGNEPNNGAFWKPQYDDGGTYIAARDYEALLARTYDALHAAARPSGVPITVIGGALAPRGTDHAAPGKRESRSPSQFIVDLGAAYGADVAAGRRAPIMDAFALHATPLTPGVSPTQAQPPKSKQLGIADYPRLVALLGANLARAGSQQLGATLPIYYTEYGIETDVTQDPGPYTGTQPTTRCGTTTCPLTVKPEQQQTLYTDAIGLAACQRTVAGFFLFHLVDDQELERWQSGLFYYDLSAKSSLGAVSRAAIAARDDPVASCAAAATR